MKVKQLKNASDAFDVPFPAGKLLDAVGFGANSVDHLCEVSTYPERGGKCEIVRRERLPGGQVATAIAFLSRMGLRTKYIGKVGDDDPGRFFLDGLAAEPMDSTSVVVAPQVRNQSAFIVVDRKSGERTVFFERDARLDFAPSELDRESICSGRLVHLDGCDAAGAAKAAAWCQQEGIPVVMDLDSVVTDCRRLIEQVDFLIVSENFPSEYTGIADRDVAFSVLGREFRGFLGMTIGDGGAVAWVDGRAVGFAGLEIEAIDTTGAGDIFHGGFIYGLLQNWPLGRIMAFANAAAGLSCLHRGARSGIRELSEILLQADAIESESMSADGPDRK